jgi:hypothetical protein
MAAVPALGVSLYALMARNDDTTEQCPADHNGVVGSFSIANPVDTIDPKYKVCCSNGNAFNLRYTIALALYYAVYPPGSSTATEVALTEAHVSNAMELIGIRITQQNFIALVKSCNDPPVLHARVGDALTPAICNTMPGFTVMLHHADVVYKTLVDNPEVLAGILGNSDLVIMALVANALHRKQSDGHNWFSGQGASPGSASYRLLGIAGGKKAEFDKFMRSWGHDLWHFCPDEVIYKLADMVCGNFLTGYPWVVAANDGENAVFEYAGRNVAGQEIQDVLKMPDSTTDRWPPGTLGVASVLKGLDAVSAMLVAISVKCSVKGAEELVSQVNSLRISIGDTQLTRSELSELRGHLGKTISIGYGFLKADSSYAVTAGNSPALEKFASNYPTELATGTALYKLLGGVDATQESSSGFVSSLMNEVIRSIAGASTVSEELPEILAPREALIAHVPMTASEKAAESAKELTAAMAGRGASVP